MPYIKQEDRHQYDTLIIHFKSLFEKTKKENEKAGCGHLNYLITRLIHEYIEVNGLSYHTLNEVAGVISCLDKEMYRRIASAYEDKKIIENGDVNIMS